MDTLTRDRRQKCSHGDRSPALGSWLGKHDTQVNSSQGKATWREALRKPCRPRELRRAEEVRGEKMKEGREVRWKLGPESPARREESRHQGGGQVSQFVKNQTNTALGAEPRVPGPCHSRSPFRCSSYYPDICPSHLTLLLPLHTLPHPLHPCPQSWPWLWLSPTAFI